MDLIVRPYIESLGGSEIMHVKHLGHSIFIFFFNLNLVGWHRLIRVYRVIVYISATHILDIAWCAYHPKSKVSSVAIFVHVGNRSDMILRTRLRSHNDATLSRQ